MKHSEHIQALIKHAASELSKIKTPNTTELNYCHRKLMEAHDSASWIEQETKKQGAQDGHNHNRKFSPLYNGA